MASASSACRKRNLSPSWGTGTSTPCSTACRRARTHLGFPNGRDSAEQPGSQHPARSRGDPQEALGRIVRAPLRVGAARRAAWRGRSTSSPPTAAANSSSAKNGLPSERLAIICTNAIDGAGPEWAARRAATSSRPNGSSTMVTRNLTCRTPSTSRRIRSLLVSSSALRVASTSTGCAATLWVRKRIRSRLDASAQCTSSSRSNTGAAAADQQAVLASPRTPGAAGWCTVVGRAAYPSGRSASTNGWYGSSVPTRSIDRPVRTSNPSLLARAATSAANLVLPMPASPQMSTVAPRPCRAEASMPSSTLISLSRPTNNVPGGTLHPPSITPATGNRRASTEGNGRVRRRGRKISPLARCGTGPADEHARVDRFHKDEEARDDSGRTTQGRMRRPGFTPSRAAAACVCTCASGARWTDHRSCSPTACRRATCAGPEVRQRAGRRVPAGGI